MQAPGDKHDTEVNTLPTEAEGLVVGTTDHAVPFQASASVWLTVPLKSSPTAVHHVVDRHETSVSSEKPPVPWSGLGTIDQSEPFHSSTNVSVGPATD